VAALQALPVALIDKQIAGAAAASAKDKPSQCKLQKAQGGMSSPPISLGAAVLIIEYMF
jgi:hypothetical protein